MGETSDINCEVTGKLLARRSEKGVFLWCKLCRTEHFIAWRPEENEGQNADKVALQAALCYNLSR
jgi:hypothetical protein